MSVVATPRPVSPNPSPRVGLRWARREVVYEALEQEARQRGVRRKLNADLFENALAVYEMARRRAQAGDGHRATLTKAQVRRDTDMSEETVRACLRKLERAGLLQTQTLTDAAGKYRGLRVELLPVNEVVARSRGCSSAG